MTKKVIAIFDIGKTNKKFFLFDQDYKEIHSDYVRFDELQDEEGFPMENLPALVGWMKKCIDGLLADDRYEVLGINFSTYGASLVHLDANGEQVGDFYNYLKPFPESLKTSFLEKYGPEPQFCAQTASPWLGMVNSGLQLYYLKEEKPAVFNQIKHTLHFPQYLSYIFTKALHTDVTSIGCHTMFWDYAKNEYHQWLTDEGVADKLSPVEAADVRTTVMYGGKQVKFGMGVHDSSSALIPYVKSSEEPFLLISTGTWSITMNPKSTQLLTPKDLAQDCLNFQNAEGGVVRASRLFLGNELRQRVMALGKHFGIEYHIYKGIKYNPNFESGRAHKHELMFKYEGIDVEQFGYTSPSETRYSDFTDFEDAYHHLLDELTDLQVHSVKLAMGESKIKKIYIDGGFGANELYTQMLANKLSDMEIYSTSFSLGSALGAAIMVNDGYLPQDFMKKNYNIIRHLPEVKV